MPPGLRPFFGTKMMTSGLRPVLRIFIPLCEVVWYFCTKRIMRNYCLFLIFVIIASCRPEKKVCEFSSPDEALTVYNHILMDLIENHMRGTYLGGKEEELREKYYYGRDEVDTAAWDAEFTKAHNEVYNNPAKFCTLYLDTTYRQRFFYDSLGSIPDPELKALVNEYTNDDRTAVDNLNAYPTYAPSELGLCIARVEYLCAPFEDTPTCSFGKLQLSGAVLNISRDKGLMFYRWTCGHIGLCGHSGMIRIVKDAGRWRIQDYEYWSVF